MKALMVLWWMTLKGGPLSNFALFFSLLGVNDQTLVEYLYCD